MGTIKSPQTYCDLHTRMLQIPRKCRKSLGHPPQLPRKSPVPVAWLGTTEGPVGTIAELCGVLSGLCWPTVRSPGVCWCLFVTCSQFVLFGLFVLFGPFDCFACSSHLAYVAPFCLFVLCDLFALLNCLACFAYSSHVA